MEKLFLIFQKLLKETDTSFFRYIYTTINWDNRMIGITGPRGVGKTTLVLQHIKKDLDLSNTLYVTAEDFYFANNRLLDLAEAFTKRGGKNLFIDEIHKYEDWAKELKLIYDYHPDLNVVFTGSSVLDLKRGSSDLSRRAVMYQMQGLSFREYLQIFHRVSSSIYTLDEILEHKVELPELKHPLPLFEDYLKRGYYPFALEEDFDTKLQQVVNQTLENDIPMYAGMNVATGRKLKQLLSIIAQSVPFKPNMTKIAAALSASRNNIADYCHYIEEAGMIAQLRNSTSGIRGLGKVEKIYLDNTNLIYNLASENANIGNVRETFFFNQVSEKHKLITSPFADFLVGDYTFEIGGKNKGKKQIQNVKNAFVVKDDLEYGFLNTIPLWHFGFLY
ncbi:MAG: AAA family ATPase [Prolixibacteraceae bacterium]|nr:AAA family ATPase [Prolixibacteraceae bacterium]MBN2649256.1 AAA family ATPase [Prolixibacteraceae bacterium]